MASLIAGVTPLCSDARLPWLLTAPLGLKSAPAPG